MWNWTAYLFVGSAILLVGGFVYYYVRRNRMMEPKLTMEEKMRKAGRFLNPFEGGEIPEYAPSPSPVSPEIMGKLTSLSRSIEALNRRMDVERPLTEDSLTRVLERTIITGIQDGTLKVDIRLRDGDWERGEDTGTRMELLGGVWEISIESAKEKKQIEPVIETPPPVIEELSKEDLSEE